MGSYPFPYPYPYPDLDLFHNQLHRAKYSTGNLKGKQKKRQPQVAEKTWLLKSNLLRIYAAQPEMAEN